MSKNYQCGGKPAFERTMEHIRGSHSYEQVDEGARRPWYEVGQVWRTRHWTGRVTLARKKPAHKAGRVTIKWRLNDGVAQARVERLHHRYPPQAPDGEVATLMEAP